jgi:hypothetical protein
MTLIKVEALNIYNTVYAALDLSAVRGASLWLLDMPERLEKLLKVKFGDVQLLTSGASKATFRIDEGSGNPEDIEATVRGLLAQACPYATIGVACAKEDPSVDYFVMEEKLLAQIRLNQMKSFSFAGLKNQQGDGVCSLDRVRPWAGDTIQRGEKSKPVSREVYDFHKYGAIRKQTYIHEHAGISGPEYRYTSDLNDLTANESAGALNHKMALFYADGNHFGKIVRKAFSGLNSGEQLKGIQAFDKQLQDKRKEFLYRLLEATDSDHWQTSSGERRIELLLWGGDELMLVVPAWCGWEVAELFAEVMRDATVSLDGHKLPLKHAAGLIFAHHKAPIHSLAKLAAALANDEAKDGLTTDGSDGRASNRISYLVLESFDHVGEQLSRFRKLQWPDEEARKGMVLSSENGNLTTIRETFTQLRDSEFPRRKVYEVVREISRGKKWGDFEADIEPFLDHTGWNSLREKWRNTTGGPLSSWYHLAELWDYLSPTLT